ncbi:hypothetical protein N1851_020433 [Merluccius polli]|uniref:Reverse transcriptase domain-containing protein n=1 Tax=Merluccius polli TaxID=89951 RepID=A0AA47NYV7_MERPO|nr:hypothetical protein N1851_020433 [Merluccius polli]
MKSLERLGLVHVRPLVKPSLDPLQFAYRPKVGVDDTIIFPLHRAYAHLERPGSTGCVSDVVVSNTGGAPQGILSPSLFTLYTSDLTYQVTKSCHLQKFSDDSAIVGCIGEGKEAEYRCVGVDVEYTVQDYKDLGVLLDNKQREENRGCVQESRADSASCGGSCQSVGTMLRVVLPYVVARLRSIDTSRITKLTRKAGSVLGAELDPLVVVSERSPAADRCTTEHHRKSLLLVAVKLHNLVYLGQREGQQRHRDAEGRAGVSSSSSSLSSWRCGGYTYHSLGAPVRVHLLWVVSGPWTTASNMKAVAGGWAVYWDHRPDRRRGTPADLRPPATPAGLQVNEVFMHTKSRSTSLTRRGGSTLASVFGAVLGGHDCKAFGFAPLRNGDKHCSGYWEGPPPGGCFVKRLASILEHREMRGGRRRLVISAPIAEFGNDAHLHTDGSAYTSWIDTNRPLLDAIVIIYRIFPSHTCNGGVVHMSAAPSPEDAAAAASVFFPLHGPVINCGSREGLDRFPPRLKRHRFTTGTSTDLEVPIVPLSRMEAIAAPALHSEV